MIEMLTRRSGIRLINLQDKLQKLISLIEENLFDPILNPNKNIDD